MDERIKRKKSGIGREKRNKWEKEELVVVVGNRDWCVHVHAAYPKGPLDKMPNMPKRGLS
jgi:hypothetical protein